MKYQAVLFCLATVFVTGCTTRTSGDSSELAGADYDDPTFYRIEIVSKDSGLLGECHVMPSIGQRRNQDIPDGEPLKTTDLYPKVFYGSGAVCEIDNKVSHRRSIQFAVAHPQGNYEHFGCSIDRKPGLNQYTRASSQKREAIDFDFGIGTARVKHYDCTFTIGDDTGVVVNVGLAIR